MWKRVIVDEIRIQNKPCNMKNMGREVGGKKKVRWGKIR